MSYWPDEFSLEAYGLLIQLIESILVIVLSKLRFADHRPGDAKPNEKMAHRLDAPFRTSRFCRGWL
jgi:hypothetical protein